MRVIKHGMYYENNRINCSCGCEYEYDANDVYKDTNLTLTSNPPQYRDYVVCPECKARTYLSTTMVHGHNFRWDDRDIIT